MIKSDAVTADIGADHGKLSIALLQSGKTRHVLASDISEASLDKARALARSCGQTANIDFFVSPGLSHIMPGSVDSIVLAGMGGEQIADILEVHPEAARSAKQLVMQPMRGTAELRLYLHTHGYRTLDERIVLDAGRYYPLLCAADGPPERFVSEPVPAALLVPYGALPILRRDPLMLSMLRAYRSGHTRRLEKAQARGRTPQSLVKILQDLDILIQYMEVRANASQ